MPEIIYIMTTKINGMSDERLRCLECSNSLKDKHILKENPITMEKYPLNSFLVYKCPNCGHLNDSWMINYNKKSISRESIIRTIFFESYYNQCEIDYEDAIRYIKNYLMKYDESYLSDIENDEEFDNKIRNQINSIFKKALIEKGIVAYRVPERDISDEMYDKIIISPENKFETFFNKRVIRQMDFKYFNLNLDDIRKKIETNREIKRKDRWFAGIEFFEKLYPNEK